MEILTILFSGLLMMNFLRIPGQETGDNLFKHSSELQEGMGKKNQDVYQGVMYANSKTSVAEFTNGDAYADMTTMTDTFKIHKRGMALINFNSKIISSTDQPNAGGFVKIVVDGVDVTGSEKGVSMDYYVTVALTDYPINVADAGYIFLGSTAIVALDEGEHTIKIQGRRYSASAADVHTYDRRLDIVVWAAPEQ